MSGGGHTSSGGKRRKKHEEHEEHVNHERWLITYGDMLTLLMVLFVVLFAISNVDEKKAAAIFSGIAAGFGERVAILPQNDSILPGQPNATTPDTLSVPKRPDFNPSLPVSGIRKENKDAAKMKADAEKAEFEKIVARIKGALKAEGLASKLEFVLLNDGSLKIITRDVMFDANRAEITPAGQRILRVIGPLLADVDNSLAILGHTNQANVKPLYYRNALELSAARATEVAAFLLDNRFPTEDGKRDRINEDRIVTVEGRGSNDPYYDPKLDWQKALEKNKRVEIIVLTSLTARDQAALNEDSGAETAPAATTDPVSPVPAAATGHESTTETSTSHSTEATAGATADAPAAEHH